MFAGERLERKEHKMADKVEKCAVCGVRNPNLQRCSRCKRTCYCGRECQRSDWKTHKLKCQAKEAFTTPGLFPWQHRISKTLTDLQGLAKFICRSLVQYNFCVIDNLLAEGKAVGVLEEVKTLRSTGVFRQGQLSGGRTASDGSQKFTEPKLRGDMITWLEGNEPHLGQIAELIRYLDELVTCCCSDGLNDYHIEGRTKAMVAYYPGKGTGYVQHVDNPDGDGRCLTVLYYLNQGWIESDGGKLRIYQQDGFVDIEPRLNRLLLFWSDERCPHEVLPSNSGRYAITVWYFDSKQRRQAKLLQHHNLNGNLETEILLKEVETRAIERNLAKLKLDTKSEELVRTMLSEADLDALSTLIKQSASPSAALTAAGIATSIQEALLKVLAQRDMQSGSSWK